MSIDFLYNKAQHHVAKVILGFVFSSIPPSKGNLEYFGAWYHFGSCQAHPRKQHISGSCLEYDHTRQTHGWPFPQTPADKWPAISPTSKSLFCSACSGNMPSTGAMHSRFDRSAIAHESAVSARWFLRLALLSVLSCASLHSFSSLLVFWIPVFQVLWISIACLEAVVRTRDYWAVTIFDQFHWTIHHFWMSLFIRAFFKFAHL